MPLLFPTFLSGLCLRSASVSLQISHRVPRAVAPEIISKSVTAPVSDIWSLGCTVIELISGSPPYWNLGPAVALFRMVEDKHPPMPKNVTAVRASHTSVFFLGVYVSV